MVQQNGNEYMTTHEVVDYLGKTERMIQRYIGQGKLTKYKRGWRTMFLRSEVEKLHQDLYEVRLADEQE